MVSGGKPQTYGSSGAKEEAYVGRDYLVDVLGVDKEHVLVEPTAYHTLDNII